MLFQILNQVFRKTSLKTKHWAKKREEDQQGQNLGVGVCLQHFQSRKEGQKAIQSANLYTSVTDKEWESINLFKILPALSGKVGLQERTNAWQAHPAAPIPARLRESGRELYYIYIPFPRCTLKISLPSHAVTHCHLQIRSKRVPFYNTMVFLKEDGNVSTQ